MSTTIIASSAQDTTTAATETVVIAQQKELYSKQTFEEKETESQDGTQEQEQEKEEQTRESNEEVTDTEEEEEETNYIKGNEMSEFELINSEFFGNELLSAFENIEEIAKIDRGRILTCAVQEYIKNTGEEPTQNMVSDALKTFEIYDSEESESESEESENENNENEEEKSEVIEEEESGIDTENESEEEVIEAINVGVFEKEFSEALENVKNLGKKHQEIFVNNLCDTFIEINGTEPSINDLGAIFGRIKNKFSEEAREAFIEENEVSSSDDSDEEEESDNSDSDYSPNDEDIQMIENDKQIDIEEEDEIDSFDEDYIPENDTFDYSKDINDDIEFESDDTQSDKENNASVGNTE